MSSKKKKVRWYAKGGDIARCGPFKTQEEAAAAMRLVRVEGSRRQFPDDVFVWPETAKEVKP